MDASKDRKSNTHNHNNAIDNGLNASPSAINTNKRNNGDKQKESEMGNKNGKKNGSNINYNASGASGNKNRKGGNNRKRCDKCGKKLGLACAFLCRCGGTFCAVHRYSFHHDCKVDYRALGAEKIRRENPVVNGEKIRKL